MKKPEALKIKLFEMDPIISIEVTKRWVTEDRQDTYIVLKNNRGKKAVHLWDSLGKTGVCGLLDIGVEWNSIARLKRQYQDEVINWKKFEDQNSKDMAEYERLRKKLFGEEK